ncbi:DUF6862 domain-containing protein [Rosenbergiella australiborealis]
MSTTEKSRQTELNYKQNLTPQEKQERDALNHKDSDSDMAVYLACNKGGGDCQAERAKAKEAQDTYFNQTYLNPKEAQAGYKQIENLLESTDPNAKEVFNILDGYTQAFMTFGYTEEEARARAGTYVGSIYVLGGMSAVLSSNSLTKQFGKDVATEAKPSRSTTSSFDASEIRFSQNTVSFNKTDRDTGTKYTYDNLVSSMKKSGWKGDPIDVIKMPDGKMTSMDNTRINAARDAGIRVEANVRNFNDPLPKDMVDSGRFGSATTWGEAITERINNQSGSFSKNNPYGTTNSPRMMGKEK